MNTKLIMMLSASLLALAGIALSFLPKEIASFLGNDSSAFTTLVLQLLGSLYLAFAMVNWMTKGSMIGGIYNRPIAIGNFAHFFIGSITLVKAVGDNEQNAEIIMTLTVAYSVLAICFTYILMTTPKAVAGEK